MEYLKKIQNILASSDTVKQNKELSKFIQNYNRFIQEELYDRGHAIESYDRYDIADGLDSERIYTHQGPLKHDVYNFIFRRIESFVGIIPTERGDIYRSATFEQFKYRYQLDENNQRISRDDPMDFTIMDMNPDQTISARKFSCRREEFDKALFNQEEADDSFAPFIEIKEYFEKLKKEFTLSSDTGPEM